MKKLSVCCPRSSANALIGIGMMLYTSWRLTLLALVSGALSGTRMLIFNSASERVVAHIRARLFRALLRQDLTFFDSNVTGALRADCSRGQDSC